MVLIGSRRIGFSLVVSSIFYLYLDILHHYAFLSLEFSKLQPVRLVPFQLFSDLRWLVASMGWRRFRRTFSDE